MSSHRNCIFFPSLEGTKIPLALLRDLRLAEARDEVEEVSQLALVVVLAAVLLACSQLFMERRSSQIFDGLGFATETLRAVKKGAAPSSGALPL
jgi:hypothetical protein